MTNTIDHITIGAADLDQGAAFVQAAFGVTIPRGGKHPDMATHNCVMRTGPGQFIEVIAIDPEAPHPQHPRWFGLDLATRRERLRHQPAPIGWVVSTSDLAAVRAASPVDLGPVRSMSRGALSWQLTVPDSGLSAFDGLIPSFIQWDGDQHPSQGMQPSGLQLEKIILRHPDANGLSRCLAALSTADLAEVEADTTASLAFVVRLPDGRLCKVD